MCFDLLEYYTHFTVIDAVTAALWVDKVVHNSAYIVHLVLLGFRLSTQMLGRLHAWTLQLSDGINTTPVSSQGCPEHSVCKIAKWYCEEHQRKT